MPVKVRVYAGFDYKSRLAVDAVREAAVILAAEYAVKVDVEVLEFPFGDDESGELGLPEVWVGDRLVARGEPPSIAAIVDAAFKELERGLAGSVGIPLPPLANEEGENGLLSV